MLETEAAWWNANNLSVRFSLCRINPSYPFPKPPASVLDYPKWTVTQPSWLFFEEASLNRLLTLKREETPKPVTSAPSIEPPDISLADYAAHLQAVADKLDADGVSIRAVKKPHIAQLWPANAGLCPKVESITALMKGGSKGRPGGNKMSVENRR